ncbi:PrgI family protein [Parvimonas parva]|uniref:PrgI family protein n=1 Tax=Parvimonas parva TaxID=2769485 RepID=UPI001E5C16A2|nr:PrgI family protein [Parvimonas parva]
MKIVAVPKDLREIEDSFFKNLTKKQLVHLIVATPVLFSTYAVSKIFIDDIFISSVLAFLSVVPIFANLFYKKDGMNLAELLKYRYLQENKNKKIRFLNYKNLYEILPSDKELEKYKNTEMEKINV